MAPKPLPKPEFVTLPGDWQELLDLPDEDLPRIGAPRRTFTPEEDFFILEARKRGIVWPVIEKKTGICESTMRKRLRQLEARK
jgi:hypothetical protein